MRIKNLSKNLNGFQLGSINLEVEPGYIIGVIGKNGSGKSSLFNCMLGALGYEGIIEGMTQSEVSFVLEKNPFPWEYSAKDIAATFAKIYDDFNYEKFFGICEKYNVPVGKPIDKLSRGMGMVVQMAFAMSKEANVLILDEPTAHFDSYAREELYDFVSQFMENPGHTVFWASNIMEELDRRADFVLGLKKGHMEFFTAKEELLEQYSSVKGTRKQLDYVNKALLGRKDYETYSTGLLKNSENVLNLGYTKESAKLADIVEYVL